MLGGDRRSRRRSIAEPWPERPAGQRLAGDALNRDTEEDEIDVRVNGRTVPPLALEDERTQARRIVAISVDRLDRREEGAMDEAVPEAQPALGCLVDIVLTQVGYGIG